ncbi:hypothetical protein PHAVU_004G166500 [Phaseolus vulgaris]|uniref:Uncharacterized protein n=1 Tax=Phaseolus vulgaris TaxID=3885 RepID=V7C3W6_PHAVU|nr:hypothetical protein PHAVU_004G166500g [Phaseolus vulgaris]ESW24857.1 hypothetical protein PHAVU_004G166500g [Phaseolus vulgaris]
MGNSPSGLRLLGNGKYCSYHVKLDNAATITVTKHEEITNDEEKIQDWELKYKVDGMSCTLSISRTTDRNSGSESISISVSDLYPNIGQHSTLLRPQCATLYVFVGKEKKKNAFLHKPYEVIDTIFREAKKKQYGESRSRRGEVETYYWAYGSGTRMGLLVTEKKKIRINNEEQTYMVTVAHYYVNSGSGRNCGGDIGFSVVVEIGERNGGLDFSVEGPVEHPSSALVFMIEEVIRTGTWKLSSCPHCKNIQCQRRLRSESEDSDATPPTPSSHGTQRNVTNRGEFNGDGNGNIIHAETVNIIRNFFGLQRR